MICSVIKCITCSYSWIWWCYVACCSQWGTYHISGHQQHPLLRQLSTNTAYYSGNSWDAKVLLSCIIYVGTKDLKKQLERELYSQNRDGILQKQRQAYSQNKMVAASADINRQENETQTRVSISIGNEDQHCIHTYLIYWLSFSSMQHKIVLLSHGFEVLEFASKRMASMLFAWIYFFLDLCVLKIGTTWRLPYYIPPVF